MGCFVPHSRVVAHEVRRNCCSGLLAKMRTPKTLTPQRREINVTLLQPVYVLGYARTCIYTRTYTGRAAINIGAMKGVCTAERVY